MEKRQQIPATLKQQNKIKKKKQNPESEPSHGCLITVPLEGKNRTP
jgi:hypothetical protein